MLARLEEMAHGYKTNEVLDLLYVIGNELKVAKLEVDNMKKEKKIYALRWSMSRLCMSM
jgi:hypothetical protein